MTKEHVFEWVVDITDPFAVPDVYIRSVFQALLDRLGLKVVSNITDLQGAATFRVVNKGEPPLN